MRKFLNESVRWWLGLGFLLVAFPGMVVGGLCFFVTCGWNAGWGAAADMLMWLAGKDNDERS